MKTTTDPGRGKYIFVDGSDPICAVILRPKSLRASGVAPVHIGGACTERRLLSYSRVRTQGSTNRTKDLRSIAHPRQSLAEEMKCHY